MISFQLQRVEGIQFSKESSMFGTQRVLQTQVVQNIKLLAAEPDEIPGWSGLHLSYSAPDSPSQITSGRDFPG